MTHPIAHGGRPIRVCCWPSCFAEAEHADVPLCESHHRRAGLAWLRDHIDIVREVVGASSFEVMIEEAAARARARQPELETAAAAARAERDAHAVVYYVRFGDRVKIGYTTQLHQRLSNLRALPGALMATEPGGRDVEALRHRQFADERYGRREDFALSDRLAAHIAGLGGGIDTPSSLA